MVVSIDKATALKMHDKMRKHWAKRQACSSRAGAVWIGRAGKQQLQERLKRLETVDMALIVSRPE